MGEINSMSVNSPDNNTPKNIDLRSQKLVISFDIDKTAINKKGDLDPGFLNFFTMMYKINPKKLFDIYFIPMTSNSINEVDDCIEKIKNGLRPTIEAIVRNETPYITDDELNEKIENELNRLQFPYATTYCGSIIYGNDKMITVKENGKLRVENTFKIIDEKFFTKKELTKINNTISKYNILKCVIPMFRGTMQDGEYKDVITQPILKTATSFALNLFKKKEDKKNANGSHAGLNIQFHTGLKTNKNSIQQYIDDDNIINEEEHKNVYEITPACIKLLHPITSTIMFRKLKKELAKMCLTIYKGSIYDIIPARTKKEAYKYMYANDENLQKRYVIHIGDGRNDAEMMNLIINGEKKSIGIAWGKHAKDEVKDVAVTNLADATVLANEINKGSIDMQTLINNSIDGAKADLYTDDTTTTTHFKFTTSQTMRKINSILSTINPFSMGPNIVFGSLLNNQKSTTHKTNYYGDYNDDLSQCGTTYPNTNNEQQFDAEPINSPKTMFRGKI